MIIAVVDWIPVAVQAGGAIAVCGMFLWYLKTIKTAEDQARETFLQHLVAKDEHQREVSKEYMSYLKDRDGQSKEIALTGHAALREVTSAVNSLSESFRHDLKEGMAATSKEIQELKTRIDERGVPKQS